MSIDIMCVIRDPDRVSLLEDRLSTSDTVGDGPIDNVTPMIEMIMAGRAAEARERAEAMLAAVESAAPDELVTALLSVIAIAAVDGGDVAPALVACERGLTLASDAVSVTRTVLLCVSGVAQVLMGRTDDGLGQLRVAVRVAQDPALGAEAFPALSNLALATTSIGLYEASEALFQQAAASPPPPWQHSLLHHLESWAWLHAEWALALGHEGDHDGEREHLARAAVLAKELVDLSTAILGRSDAVEPVEAGGAAGAVGLAVQALAEAKRGAVDVAGELLAMIPTDLPLRARADPTLPAQLAQGWVCWTRGDVAGAAEAARFAAAIADRVRAVRWQAEAYRLLEEAYSAMGRPAELAAAKERREAIIDESGWQARLRGVQLSAG